jgi:3-hydroxymyristoyl/3-hydroxydecanoyl-(acyl carrier protein) dehydratase
MPEPRIFTLDEILPILPHRPPFLFVDRVTHLDPHKVIIAERVLRTDEPQFAGHFPGQPIMPGVLVGEALAQTSGLLLGLSDKLDGGPPPAQPKMYFLAATSLKYTHPAKPGDILILRASSDREFSGLFRFSVEATVRDKLIASGSLMLASVETKL